MTKKRAQVENLFVAGINTRMGPASLIVYADHFFTAAQSDAGLEATRGTFRWSAHFWLAAL
jgi:hypothetical protein